ncbi:tandem-95 repeat protein, partial [Methylobacterium platani]
MALRLAGDGATLVVAVRDGDDRITIADRAAIESFAFADGTVWTAADLAARWQTATAGADVIVGTGPDERLAGGAGNDRLFAAGGRDTLLGEAGDDVLTGSAGIDTLDGGTGHDTLAGGLGDDVYLWGRGAGNDVVIETGGIDRVEIGAGVAPGDVRVIARGTASLVLRLRDTGEELTLTDALASAANAIESVAFADGTVWNAAELRTLSLLGGDGDDAVTGSAGADRLEGGAGDDTLAGFEGDDVLLGGEGRDRLQGGGGADRLVGGRGDDTLSGGAGADIYVFGAGDGADTIDDRGDAAADGLQIAGYGLERIRFGARGRDLVIRFSDSADRITVLGGLDDAAGGLETVDILADGVTLSLAEIRARLVDDVALTGRWLAGGAGDDALAGGDGDDVLSGGEGADTLGGGAGDDLFADLSADASVDTLTGGAGRDTYALLPVGGDAAVVADVITDFRAGPGGDVIRLSVGNPNPFEAGVIRLAQSGSDTLVLRRGTAGPDAILVRLLGVEATALTAANFDGVSVAVDNTVSLGDDDGAHVLDGSPLDDRIFGNGGADTIRGFSGNDRLAGGADGDLIEGGLGDDLIAGEDGDDRIVGGGGSDVMAGGTGDDVLVGTGDGSLSTDTDVFSGGRGDDTLAGGLGTDIYRFARGDGRDTLVDRGGTDRIVFSGITAAEVGVVQVGRGIELRVADEGGRIRILDALDGGSAIETVAFADGSAWTWSEVLARALQGTGGDDRLALPVRREDNLVTNGDFNAFAAGEVLDGVGGSLRLRAIPGWTEASGQAFRYRPDASGVGYGLDLEAFFAHLDVSQVVSGRQAGERLVLSFDYGLPAGAGTRGLEVSWNGTGVASLTADGNGMRTATLTVTAGAGDNILRFRGAGDRSAAGPVLDDVRLYAAAGRPGGSLAGGAGNDDLLGGTGDDTLTGGTGNDTLAGGTGDDTYVFARGDGQDLIRDGAGLDTLAFAAGIRPDEVRAVDGATNLVLEIAGTGDRIDLGGPAGPEMGIRRVTFADGTVWTQGALVALSRAGTERDDVLRGGPPDDVLSGGAGDDRLIGLAGADTLDGGPGHDRLEGGSGDDTYLFSADGGHDRILDAGGTDAVVLAPGLAPADIAVTQSRDGADLALVVTATGARLTIENALSGGRIEAVRFADGTVWTVADLLARTPTFGDDALTGDDGADVMIGGLGNDSLSGGRGDDVYRFARGDGSDVVHDRSGSGADRLEISGYAAAEVSFHRLTADGADVAIRFAGTTDQIVIVDALALGGAGIETVALAGGPDFSVADIRRAILASRTTPGNDVVVGTDGPDTLAGGRGDDLLRGAGGDDTYLYRRGDGDDRIEAAGAGIDTVSLADYVPSDVVSALRAGPDSHDLVVTFAGAGDRLVLRDALHRLNGAQGSLTLRFADGTTWDRDAMRARALADSDGSGDDTVTGFDGADTFAARPGDDLLAGLEGGDLYRFGAGAGHDTVAETGTSGTDRIEIRDFASTQARIEQLYRGSDSVVLRFTGAPADSLTVLGALAPDQKGIESYTFADGVVWTKDTLVRLLGNRAPVALDDGFYSVRTGDEIVLKAADLLRNDFDADGDRLRIVAVETAATGLVRIDERGDLRYRALDGFYGAASLAYTVSDGRNGFATASVDLRVRPIATARPDSGFTVAEDSALVIRVERLLANDLDGDRMVVGQVYGAVNGTVALASDGNITFTPSPDFNGTAAFTYAANTPEGGRAEAAVTIQVGAVNDAPVARADRAEAVAEGTRFSLDPRTLLANDADIDGDALTVRSVRSGADVAVSIGEDGLIHVEPRAYYWGEAAFEYVVADAAGATATGQVRFTVTPVNDPPDPGDDRFETTDAGAPIREDNPVVVGADRLLANDVEHDGEAMTVTAVRGVRGGAPRLLENGTVLFTPWTDFNGEAAFDYRVEDGHGGASWARATLVYQAVNDLPVAADDSYEDRAFPILRGREDQAIEIPVVELLKNDIDPEGFTVRFKSAGSAIHGDIRVTDHGTVVFTPDADYWGEATFAYLVSDREGAVDGATVTLWFENVGDAPPVARRDVIYVNEDIPVVIPIAQLLANDDDVDRDPVRFVGWRAPTALDALTYGADAGNRLNGTIEADGAGNLVFTPDRDASRSSGIVYRITDDADGEAESYVDIVVVPSNDDPTVGDDEGFVTPLGVPLVLRTADLLANDFDIEQADRDGDGTIDVDLDDPRRPRPAFDGVVGVFDAEALALGERIPRGEAEAVTWAGETFVVVRFAEGFTGAVAVEYRIADADGATDTGFAMARVDAAYDGALRGTSRADLLVGSAGADIVRALSGSDLVRTGAGDDAIEAGDGDDAVEAGAGDDWIAGGLGADRIDGGDGFDTASFRDSAVGIRADLESRIGQGGTAQGDTYTGLEALVGSGFADQLGGDAGDNRLDGEGGDDLLEGRGGDDRLAGGAGDDRLVGGAGRDTLDGGTGTDTADYAFGAVGIAVSLATGRASGGDAEGDVLVAIENLTGTDAADTLEGDAGGNVLAGGRGDDVLTGGRGDDTLIGGRGADRLDGGDGIDVADYTLSAEGVLVDMENGAAGGGDAEGDAFSGIEIVQGSYHDDTIRGDANDNRLRGGRGADLLDGRGGVDTADYSRADEGVSVDLAAGQGTGGEAAGDRLVSIEGLLGSLHADRLAGSGADERFQGGRGDDTLAGAAGSDTYLFGFDDGQDLVVEEGSADDTDRLVLAAAVAPRDVSVIREGDDLLLEFERQDGFLVDAVRARGHFLGRETGLEEVVFADGTVWARERLDALQRLGRFNAADDVVRFAREDEPLVIDPALLTQNDAAGEAGALTLVGVGRAVNGSVGVRPDGRIAFLGAPDFNGDAFFTYTVRDAFGRESSARVEVDLAAVNDAPTALDDPLVPAVEDRILRIRIASLLANDLDVDGEFEGLHIARVDPLTNGAGIEIDRYKESGFPFAATNATARLDGDYLELRLRPDYFGPAGFVYTLSDADGATATARVEIAVAPVNDAPRDRDRVHEIRLGRDAVLAVADLLADTYDVEGDAITFVGLHGGLDGEPGSNGRAVLDAGALTFTPFALGRAGIAYDVVDARGAAATLTYDLWVRPLNDAPRAANDYGLRTLEDQVLVIDPAVLLANDTDENGDTLVVESVARFAEGGKVRLREDGRIEFRPKPDYNGAARFAYTVSDGRGGTATATASITILPRNEGPILRNDRVAGIEDGPLLVIPAEAFGNDVEPDGDVLFFRRARVLGAVDHRFLSAGFTADAALADGSPLPSWLRFDPATMRFSGTPAGDAPVAVDVWVTDPANGRVFDTRLALTGTMIRQGFDARPVVLEGYEIRRPFAVSYRFGADDLDAATGVTASLADGTALPGWLAFDAATLRFTGTPPQGTTGPIAARLTFTRPGPAGTGPLVFTDRLDLDPASLPAGIGYDSRIALFDPRAGTVSAATAGGRPLPDWLSFDAATRTLGLTGFPPEDGAGSARLQVVFAPGPRALPDGVVATSDRGFTLEFQVDPGQALDAQVAAINRTLAGEAYFAAQGLFALDLEGAGPVTAARESGAPLPSWLSFDPTTLGFSGSPPPAFVGALPVRLDVAAGGGRPALSVIAEAVVDDTVKLAGLSAAVEPAPGALRLAAPQDFNGTIVLSYDAADEKGGVSASPALIFYDVAPARERPDPGADAIAAREGESTRFAVSDLLRNDRDRDRDPVRILALGQPANGTLLLELARAVIAAPDDLAPSPGATFTATRADGSPLPSWLVLDPATGTLSGEVPLAVAQSVDIRFTRTLDGVATSLVARHRLDGNAGARVVYTPAGAFSGEDPFTYVVTDDREGPATGAATVRVAPLFDPPEAVADTVEAREDTPLVIDPRDLTANDRDVDGDPIRFVGVANPRHGRVDFDGSRILFTPDRDFDGDAAFEYLVTDDRHGTGTGRVRVKVAATNRAPVATADGFDAQEDVPFVFTTAELMANDGDPDGDAITFQSLSRRATGGRIAELPDGRWQFVPDENVTGPVAFAYTIGDGRRLGTGTVTFAVAPVNDAPIANPDGAGTANDPAGVFRTTRDRPLTIDLAVLLANDRDVEGDGFAIVEVFDGDQGTVLRDGAGAVFTPAAGYVGDAGFRYRVVDARGASSVGTATLLVAPDVPLPIPVSDTGFEMLEDHVLDIDPGALMANDFVPEGSVLTFVGIEGAERQPDGTWRVAPPADFNGDLVLTYAVRNEQDFAVSTTVTIRVLPVADAPVARPDALALREDEPLTLFASQLLANDGDADGQAIVLGRIAGTHGLRVTDLGFGQLRIDPDADFNGEASFDYAIEDSTGLSATARVAVSVAPVDDAPVIAALPVLKGTEDRRFSATLPADAITDADGDALLVEIRSPGGAALPSWLAFDARTRTLSGDPPADFNGTLVLEIAASDATATTRRDLLVSIAPVNDAPVPVGTIPDAETDEDRAFSIALPVEAFADVDGDRLALTATLDDGSALPSWMSLVDGRLAGTPPRDFTGVLDLAVTASDGAETATGRFRFVVRAVNDAPVVTASPGSATGGTKATAVDAALSLSDADNATLAEVTVSIASGFVTDQDVLDFANTDAAVYGTIAGRYDTATGVLTLASSGASATVAQFEAALRAVTYRNTAAAPTAGTRSLSIMADDGVSRSAAATRLIDVTALVADAVPTAFDDVLSGTSGDDTVSLLAGSDLYDAGMGNDRVNGDDGNDTINGNEGGDWVDGGSGNDFITGGSGNDTLNGSDGDDQIYGEEDDDLVAAGEGNDTLYGGDGNDRLHGDEGDDFIDAGSGDDVLSGGNGNDRLQGEEGD